jgi:hypothetical protein
MIDPFDYRWTETQHMKQMLRYGPKEYKEDWETAVACAQIMGAELGHECLERVLDACMMRVNAYLEVTGDLPWKV